MLSRTLCGCMHMLVTKSEVTSSVEEDPFLKGASNDLKFESRVFIDKRIFLIFYYNILKNRVLIFKF